MIQSLYSFLIISSSMFMVVNHPLTMGFILLIQVIIIAMLTGLMSINYWFSYILFMIMAGGMLVLFIYMTSIAANEKFKISKMMFLSIPIITTSIILNKFIDQIPNYLKASNQNFFSTFMQKMPMTKYFNFPSSMIMMLLIIYLLISLIAVIKITNVMYGPLRQKF